MKESKELRVHQGLASGDDIPTNSWGAEYYEGDRTRIMKESIQLLYPTAASSCYIILLSIGLMM